jgi:hypothetical protein
LLRIAKYTNVEPCCLLILLPRSSIEAARAPWQGSAGLATVCVSMKRDSPIKLMRSSRFHSRAPPNITVRDYLLRIAKYTNVEPCCLLIR